VSLCKPGQLRLNVVRNRPVVVLVGERYGKEHVDPFVVDVQDRDDTYWIHPSKLSEPLTEMEILAWAALGVDTEGSGAEI
jgi:hypothetical protein